jgi:hypothetical protein
LLAAWVGPAVVITVLSITTGLSAAYLAIRGAFLSRLSR